MTVYRDKINDLLAKMFALRPFVHPANRVAVNEYLHHVWWRVGQVCMSFTPFYPSDTSLREKFQSYTDVEEARIEKNLRDFNYTIDALDTLALITGPRCIEKVRWNSRI